MNEEETAGRADPDALLAQAQRERAGTLKIFLGAAPGVGKTFTMLQAAREARREGRDVVIGVVESHGRRETEALSEGLDRAPPLALDYRGRTFHEMDLDGLLRRSPAVALVDELAHRNIPGTRHPRRYQDIEELLERGIDVWTTVNIQHLESLNDVVARITGVRMRETVPDALLTVAADVVLVDLTPGELIERLRQGKVYVPEQARAALDSFFSPSNLTALRELALQAVAERIDRDVREQMRRQGVTGPWPVRARIVVAVDGRGNSEEVVRLSRRLAERRRAPWTVVFVEGGEVDPQQRAGVERVFHLAERLGGQTALLRGHDPVAELLAYARAGNATTLVFGRSRTRPLAGFFGRTLSQRLLREGGEFEITFVPSVAARAHKRRRARRHAEAPGHYLFALLVVAVAVAVAAVLHPLLPLANLSLLFLTAVLLVAVRTAMRPALFTALISACAYNFFFTEPRYTLAIEHTDDLLTVAFFLVMALVGGHLAGRLRRQVLALRSTQAQTQTILTLDRRLAAAVDSGAVRREAVRTLAEYLRAPVVLLAAEEPEGMLARVEAAGAERELDAKALSAAQWAADHGQPAGYRTDTLPAIGWRFLPLRLEKEEFGVIGLYLEAVGVPAVEQATALDVLIGHITMALARTRLVAGLERAKVGEETERLRSALLSSVSHDLRSPLASMIGAAGSLRALGDRLSPQERTELLDSVLSEGERLNRYIQNLLDMTRLGYGTLKLERDWIGVDDLLSAALRRTRELLRGLQVTRALPAGLPLLYVHPALIEQALVNVIENAAKFSPPHGEIRIGAGVRDGQMRIDISDQGPGIPPTQRRKVFDMFFTGGDGDRGPYGSGLGLAICSGMVGAHGGRIEALPGPDGRGTTIAIHLPLFEPPGAGRGAA